MSKETLLANPGHDAIEVTATRARQQNRISVEEYGTKVGWIETSLWVNCPNYSFRNLNGLDWDVFHDGAGQRPFRQFWFRSQNCCLARLNFAFSVAFALFSIVAISKCIPFAQFRHQEGHRPPEIEQLSSEQFWEWTVVGAVAVALALDALIATTRNCLKLIRWGLSELPVIEVPEGGLGGWKNTFFRLTGESVTELQSLSVNQQRIVARQLRATARASINVMLCTPAWLNDLKRNLCCACIFPLMMLVAAAAWIYAVA